MKNIIFCLLASLAFVAFGQQTVNNFTVKTNLTVGNNIQTLTLNGYNVDALATNNAANKLNITNGVAVNLTVTNGLTVGTNIVSANIGSVGDSLVRTNIGGVGYWYPLPVVGGGGGASSITNGSTAIVSGTSGRVLYNNANVLGEMTTTGSGTTLALSTSPVLTTPTLGAATATTINGVALATNTATAGAYGSSTFIPTVTINSSGFVTGITTNAVAGSGAGIGTIGFTLDGGGSVLTTGKAAGYITVPYGGTITAWSIGVNPASSTATVKTWKVATGTAVPTISNVINTNGVSISSGTYIRSTNTVDFSTTAVAANDIFAFDLTAVSLATELTFQLYITP